jgi:hypothetical protein
MLLPRFTEKALQGKPLTVYGDEERAKGLLTFETLFAPIFWP